LLAVIASPVQGHYPLKGKPCKLVVFTPNSDDVAAEIEAKNVSCKKLRRLIRLIDSGDDISPWVCTSRVRQDGDRKSGIAHADYRCVSGSKVFVFART
jgi:hypothetical protein